MQHLSITKTKALWVLLAVVFALAIVMPAVPAQASGAEGAAAISAGDNQSLLVDADGSLWVWGSVGYDMSIGQSGSGLWSDLAYAPMKIMDGVASASAGGSHSMAIKNDGSLWAWGRNIAGQIGDGTTEYRAAPVHIMDGVATVSACDNLTMAIKTDGSLWAWGRNGYGALGDGTNTFRTAPVKIMDGVAAVAAGNYHSMAIKADGSLWAWGLNSNGQIGDGTCNVLEWGPITDGDKTTEGVVHSEIHDKWSPVRIMDGVVGISVGEVYSMAIKGDGTLWAWGGYEFDGKFDNTTSTKVTTPIMVMDNVASVSARQDYVAVVKTDGSLWTWGYNGRGQLGNGSTSDSKEPIKIMDGVAAVSAGFSHCLAIKADGSLWGWGDNRDGKVGSPGPATCTSPLEIHAYEIAVALDGRKLAFDVPPYMQNGRVLVPLRAIFEELGATIEWDGAAKTVTANNGGTTVVLTIGSATPSVNGSIVEIDQPGILLGGRTLVPLRFVAESFGVAVDWDAATHTVTITS